MKRNFLILPNTKKDSDFSFTNGIIDFLLKKGQTVSLTEEIYLAVGRRDVAMFNGISHVAVVLGGDGTILRWAHRLLSSDIPIFGINLGRLGYLAEVEPMGAESALEQIIQGDYKVEKRMVLSGVLTMEDTGEERQLYAFNDFVIHRGEISGMLPVQAYINGTFMDTFLADGMIAATPSGSTAYNFSAGGPILNPVAENILLTPICSHSAMGRSIIVTGNDHLKIAIHATDDESLPVLSVDGVEKIKLTGECGLEVEKSGFYLPLIRVTDRSFFDILRAKMLYR